MGDETHFRLSRPLRPRNNSAEFFQVNKSYQSIWCETTATWVAAPETSKAKTKRGSSRRKVVVQAVLAAAAVLGAANAMAAAGVNAIEAGVGANAAGDGSVAVGV